MSLQKFVDHGQAASAALAEWMGIYRHGGSVLSDYADQNQAEADAARQYLNAAATEIDAACKLSERVIQEVSDDVATAILAVTASAKRNVREFFECWQEYEPALLLAARRQRLELGPEGASKPDLPTDYSRNLAELAFARVLDAFKAEGRPLAHFWKVTKVAENAGVYELTSEEAINDAVAAARRQIEQRIPHPAQQKSETNGNASRGCDEVISTQEAYKLLEAGKTTLMRWAENAGVKTVSRGYWRKSDIDFLKRTKGTEAKNTDPKGS